MPARLEVIAGPMFAGKTERLIEKLKRATYAKKRILILKPARDTRTEDFIASRELNEDGSTCHTKTWPALLIASREDFRNALLDHEFDVLAIDEVQFFPLDEPRTDTLGWLGREVRELLRLRQESSLRIIVSGLDTDFSEEPFGPMPGLMALADSVEKLSAICMTCGADAAHRTQRLSSDTTQVAIGDSETYQVRCRMCYAPPAGS
jgi:thymidine kinase